jgi:hypothetical protein
VAKGSDGLFYYTVDLCVIDGQTIINPTAAPGGSGDDDSVIVGGPTPTYAPLTTATPREDGSFWHLVQAGETLFDISVAYGVDILTLETMNGISPAYQRIYAGQLLLIKTAPPPTVTPTNTSTPKPPTRTPRPSRTPRPTRITSTPQDTPTVTATVTPLPGYYKTLDQFNQRQWGLMIIGVSMIGILILFGKDIIRLVKKVKLPLKEPPNTPEEDIQPDKDADYPLEENEEEDDSLKGDQHS